MRLRWDCEVGSMKVYMSRSDHEKKGSSLPIDRQIGANTGARLRCEGSRIWEHLGELAVLTNGEKEFQNLCRLPWDNFRGERAGQFAAPAWECDKNEADLSRYLGIVWGPGYPSRIGSSEVGSSTIGSSRVGSSRVGALG
jgi:hypothetical protein